MKSILFIGISYYNYTKEIINELEKIGYKINYYPIEPRTLYYKGLRTLSKSKFKKAIDKYHYSIIENEKTNQYDIVFFLQVHYFSLENIAKLKESFNQTHFILYNWDSISTHDYRSYIKYFDTVATFDPNDANNFQIKYLPLFCTPSLQRIISVKPFLYDVYFVGSIRTIKRYIELQEFKAYCKRNQLHFSHYFHCSPVMFFRMLLSGIVPLDISFFSIKRKRFESLLKSSKAVFDFANHNQSGYTMRIFENLCLGKKIITNNKRIKEEKFFTPDRILVIENSDYSGIKEFLDLDLENPDNLFPEYYLQNWIKYLLN